MIFVRRVSGDSMSPTLKDGQLVFCYRAREFKKGQVIVAFVKGREVIKRVKRVQNGKVFLEGDNKAHSTDSRSYGSVVDTKVEGIVFWPRI